MEWARRHYDLIADIPREGAFTMRSLKKEYETRQMIREKMVSVGLLEEVGTVRIGYDDKVVYQMTEAGRGVMENQSPPANHIPMPCGHTGFSNSRDSDFLHCTTCNGRFTKEEVRDVGDE